MSRYWETSDGWQFHYATTVTTRCPWEKHPPVDVRNAAAAAGATKFDALWVRAHRFGSARDHRGGTCGACGAKVIRTGWEAYVCHPSGVFRNTVKRGGPFATRREAKEWAYEERTIHVAAIEEEKAAVR